jgi:hypothetical protein
MQQESVSTKGQGDKIIHQFIQGFLDIRKKESKQLKELNLTWRKMIEARLTQKSDIKYLLFRYEDDPWIQKILINYIFLKIFHHAALLDVDDSQPKKIK